MTYDVQTIRAQFPALDGGAAHFDGPGGSQVPAVVGDAVASTLCAAIANRGVVTAAERLASTVVAEAREAVADLLAADPAGVVFGRSMTQLTYDFSRTLAQKWGPGDEVVVTRLDHDANIRPWVQAAAAAGATVRWADFDPGTGELAPIGGLLSERTRLVAVTAAANLLGTRPDVPAIASEVHDAGALLYVDGVHLTPHAAVDITALGADFYACSPYKFLGPHVGVVAAAPALLETLHPDKLLPSSNAVPERFELGTLPYELLAGTTAAIGFLAGLVPGTGSRRSRLLESMAALGSARERAAGPARRRSGRDSGSHPVRGAGAAPDADGVVLRGGGFLAGGVRAPRGAGGERSGREFLRDRVFAAPGAGRHGCGPGGDRAVHDGGRRGPAAGRDRVAPARLRADRDGPRVTGRPARVIRASARVIRGSTRGPGGEPGKSRLATLGLTAPVRTLPGGR